MFRLKDHLRASATKDKLPAGSLYDTTAPMRAENKGTFVWDDRWQLIDHIIVSPGMLDAAGFHWKPDSSQRLEFPELFFQSRRPGAIARPNQSYTSNDFHGSGHSDHLPVSCVITK